MWDPTSLPPIPDRRTSGPDSGSRPSIHRQGSLGRSRQSSVSEPQAPPSYFTPGSPPTQPSVSEESTTTSSTQSHHQQPSPPREEPVNQTKKVPVKEKKSSLLGSLMPGLPSWLKPKNQVHLPDDSKPTIIFNESTGRWENTAEGEEDSCAPAAPPPMMAATPSNSGNAPQPGGGGAPPPMNFRAGLTKRKGRGGYVDVLSQSGMAKPMTMAPPSLNNDPALPPLGPAPSLLDPSNPPSPQGGPTSLDYGDGGSNAPNHAPPPMMMFNPSTMGGLGVDQPPAL